MFTLRVGGSATFWCVPSRQTLTISMADLLPVATELWEVLIFSVRAHFDYETHEAAIIAPRLVWHTLILLPLVVVQAAFKRSPAQRR